MNYDNITKVAALCRAVDAELQQHPCPGIAAAPPRRILDDHALLSPGGVCNALLDAAAWTERWRVWYQQSLVDPRCQSMPPPLQLPKNGSGRGRPRKRHYRAPTEDDYTPEDKRLRQLILDTLMHLRMKDEGRPAADHIAAALDRIETTKQYFPPPPKQAKPKPAQYTQRRPEPVDGSQPEITEEEWNEFFNRLPTTPLDKANTP